MELDRRGKLILEEILRVTYKKFNDIEPYDCILSPHALNVAKVMMRDNEQPYSMASFKSLMFNSYYTKRIFDVSRIRPNQTLIRKIVKELFGWQRKAA